MVTSSAAVWCSLCLLSGLVVTADPWRRIPRLPIETMVDVTNNFGLAVLKEHNIDNHNNIAISPYGVTSVLVALLEGVRGPAAVELARAMGVPYNRDVVRVGLRDIHRLLKSYFIPREGLLSGLSLNMDNVTLKEDYQNLLRFYGYDVGTFNKPPYPSAFATTTTTPAETTTTTTPAEATTLTMPTTTSSTSGTSLDDAPMTMMTTRLAEEALTTQSEIMTPSASTMSVAATTMTEISETSRATEAAAETTTAAKAEVLTSTVSVPLPTPDLDTRLGTETTASATTQEATTILTDNPTSAPETTTATEANTVVAETTIAPEAITATELPTTIQDTTTVQYETTLLPMESTTSGNDATPPVVKRSARAIDGYYTDYHKNRYIPNSMKERANSFLINGMQEEENISFMTYETILPFYYIAELKSLALRFPLDSPQYYLLLVLPEDQHGIDKLICDIRSVSPLRTIVSSLRDTYVKAVIPSFMLRGFVMLTQTLQKMGIHRVFEPRRADFTNMTPEDNIYVTNIEQAVTVTIKNYMDPVLAHNHRGNRFGPVYFRATHPFLYFVMDSQINVALMAGKVINPLNSRIQ